MASNVADDRKMATLLTVIGGPTYELLRNLLLPTGPKDKPVAQLIEALTGHLALKPLLIMERYCRHECEQCGETMAQYVVKLCHLAWDCKFGNSPSSAS